MSDNVQDRLDQGFYGTPKLKPDEQNKYLGTYRERVYLGITFNDLQINEGACLKAIELALQENPSFILKFHGKLPTSIVKVGMKIAKNTGTHFEYLSNESFKNSTDSFAMIVCHPKQALNIPDISAQKLYPDLFITKESSNDNTKKSFWSRIFGSL
ncbi:hypothetical protein FC40_GL000899 [Ligilactobacillus hayakitensis DSM 18933 = JCM 14209]|uniref:DUF1694 domain-containing protein n=1 Tax=Ligilactobacillus hayakitensis DSM 18933 = JCM 14209 TaxID=1423755 RepID=A0A0R1WNV8_9LACO|nr:YueI family protein [Ligilactobacillus hayakitensis]KRM19109.1 hypothetical protein FC40_GL000899 [Ligilactobacillus hayakitensis DSM 18933 = JCM 14209]